MKAIFEIGDYNIPKVSFDVDFVSLNGDDVSKIAKDDNEVSVRYILDNDKEGVDYYKEVIAPLISKSGSLFYDFKYGFSGSDWAYDISIPNALPTLIYADNCWDCTSLIRRMYVSRNNEHIVRGEMPSISVLPAGSFFLVTSFWIAPIDTLNFTIYNSYVTKHW